MDSKLHVPEPEEQVSQTEDINTPTQADVSANDTSAATPAEVVQHDQVPTAMDAAEDIAQEQVDFSDEEALLAAAAPEFDLGDDEAHEHDSDPNQGAVIDQTQKDYSSKNKQELLDEFGSILEARPVQSLRRDVETIKISFYKIHRTEVEQARKSFVDAGGNIEEFVAEQDPAEVRFKELFGDYRRKRDEYISTQEARKEDNLRVKQHIIEELKELTNGGELLGTTFNTFRDLQNKWKETGLVPQAYVKDLWETYNLHVENFYSVIKINKELRDLDLRRNFETKTALCEEAEALLLESSIVNAFHKLQKLHEQWREIGPVAAEYKETLWDRFREASSRINKQHQEYFEGLKDEQQRNFGMKSELCEMVEELATGVFTTRKEWNKASDKIVEIQKIWKAIGFAPKKENSKVYERFRNACDKFFTSKRDFYLQAKDEMDENLKLKIEICALAESMQESEDWKLATEELIELQKRWKETGPVARRHSDAVWKRFRVACDKFFERKSAHFSSLDNGYERNLALKRELLSEINALNPEDYSFDKIKEYQRKWGEVGFVPIKQKNEIQTEYKAVMDKLFSAVRGGERERRIDNFKGKIDNIRKGGGDKRVKTERDRLYNKVRQLEADIATLENNIGFFSRSKNAESLIKDVQDKISKAKQEMASIVDMVKLIDKQEQ